MKKYITVSLSVFLILSLILVGCNNSNDKKARRVIKDYLKSSMNDFSSYEPVEFSKLDSSFSTFNDSKEGKELNGICSNQEEYCKESYIRVEKYKYSDMSQQIIDIFQGLYERSNSRLDSIIDVRMKAEQAFKSEHNGYILSHKFRGKNALGAIMLNELVFFIDKDITKVINAVHKETYDEYQVQIQRLDSIRHADIDQLN